MIEVQVRRDDDVDVGRREAVRGERVVECERPIDRVDLDVSLSLILSPMPASIRIRRPPASHEQRPHAERDAVARVGGRALLPQRLGHHAEHGAAVEPEGAVGQRQQVEIAEAHARQSAFCFSSTSRPPTLVGWMNAMREPCAPGRGASSMKRTPFSRSVAIARSMSGTRRHT